MTRRAATIQSFDEARRREGTLNRLPPQILPIKVRRIVGSVDEAKVASLTRDFLPREVREQSTRFRSVRDAMQSDVALPPIEVYALRGDYYVVDGHHRVAAARSLGYLYLDALVHEFLLPATTDENRLYNQRLHFERLTGLHDIVLTEAGQYRKLLDQIREHKYYLASNGRPTGFKGAADDWHEYVYAPIAERLAASGVPAYFAGRTVGDLYLYVCDYKWVKSQNRGMDIGFPKALADFERLYPPPAAGVLATPLHALRHLAAPVVLAGRLARERIPRGDPAPDEEDADGSPKGTARRQATCSICGGPVGEDGALVCGTCVAEAGATV
jgi:hypothetical protein